MGFEYNQRQKKTRREEFLDAMDAMIPWSAWIAMILPFHPSGKSGRPVKGIETMLRMYLCRSGSICLMLLLKMPFMTAMPCGLSCALSSTRNSFCLIVKKYFGYVKVAYRGLAKNFNRFNQRFLNSAP